MRKVMVLVIAIAVVPLVEALAIFGQEISMLVLTPIILILFFLIIFVILIMHDKMKNKTVPEGEFTEALEPLPEDAISDEPPLDELSLESTPKSPQNAKTDYLKEMELIKQELPSKSTEETNKQLKELIKKFFSDYAGIEYKFTFEELEKELKKRNKKIVCFSDNLSKINYSPEGASDDDISELIEEFQDIIEATRELEQQAIPEFKKETEEKKKKINILLKKSEKLIKKDINQARDNYKEILALYDTLISKEKESIRPMIMNFYNRLNV